MSVHVSSAVWKANLPNPGQKLVLLALADIANHEGRCWPSVGTLVGMTALSDSAIRSHLKAMKEAGFLEINPRSTSGGRQTSNIFRILVENLPPPARVPNSGTSPDLEGEPPKSGTPTPQNLAPQNRTEEPPTGTKQKEEGASTAPPDLFGEAPAPAPKLAPPDKLPTFPEATIVRVWNESVPGAKIQALAGERHRLTGARWKQLGSNLDNWRAFCQRVGNSPFLTGQETSKSKRTFTADFDWAILPGNFLKIQEGKYDPKSKSKPDSQKYEF